MKLSPTSEQLLNRQNLLRIKDYILQLGETTTYSQMYNNNPAVSTENYCFYLNPDPGGPHGHPQWNINCDPLLGDFNTLVIRRDISGDISDDEFRDQYRFIDFSNPDEIVVTGHAAASSNNMRGLLKFAESAIDELLSEMSDD